MVNRFAVSQHISIIFAAFPPPPQKFHNVTHGRYCLLETVTRGEDCLLSVLNISFHERGNISKASLVIEEYKKISKLVLSPKTMFLPRSGLQKS